MRFGWTAVMYVALSTLACAGDSPTAPTVDSTNVVTITASGVSPLTIQIRVGERVLFINSDSVVHDIVVRRAPITSRVPGDESGRESLTRPELGDRQPCDSRDVLVS